MKPKFYMQSLAALFLSMILFLQKVKAQNIFPSTGSVGIGTTTPNSSSLLDMESTKAGLLIPRMTGAQKNTISAPATGLMIYQTTTPAGFFYYNGTAWKAMKNTGYIAGNGINLNGDTIVNSAPDKTVVLNAGTGINVTGSYPTFTISSSLTGSQWTTSGTNIVYNSGDAVIHSLTVGTGAGSESTNTALGLDALFSNSTGSYNTAAGDLALSKNTTGYSNLAAGADALTVNTTGNYNSASGAFSLEGNTTGNQNTANGAYSLSKNISGGQNTATGVYSLSDNTVGYENTANGAEALTGNTTGNANSALGYQSMIANTAGNANTATGSFSLYSNTSGSTNIAAGVYSLFANTTGYSNVAMGAYSLFSSQSLSNLVGVGDSTLFNNSSGIANTAVGSKALYSNIGGSENTAIGLRSQYYSNSGYQNSSSGAYSLYSNATGSNNTVNGYTGLYSNTAGTGNTSNGSEAMYKNTTGNNNTANGYSALYNNTTGFSNVAIGVKALFINQSASNLVAVGDSALLNNTTGTENTATGSKTLDANTTGLANTANGYQALIYNTTGSANTGIGEGGLYTTSTGSSNTGIGAGAFPFDGTISNWSGFGSETGSLASASNMVEIGNTSVTVIRGEVNFSTYSDKRIKNTIQQNVPGLAFINLLTPVTYKLDIHKENQLMGADKTINGKSFTKEYPGKYDLEQKQMTGFLAQDVEAAAAKINYDFSGIVKPQNANDLYSLRYSDFVVPLVKAVQELSAANNNKQVEIDSLQQNNISLQSQINELKIMMQAVANKEGIAIPTSGTTISSASLEQNLPNPFNGHTSISYTLPNNFLSAQILFTDNYGKTIKVVTVSGSGKGTLNLDASTLSSGLYQYSLLIDGKLIDTKKMILAK